MYDGDTFNHGGYWFRVSLPRDDDRGAPWDEEDGHGPVSDWTTRRKAPGELVLYDDRGSRWYYDFTAAVKLARRDGWNAPPYDVPGETARQRATKAALADYERLRAWCNDDWHYVGVVVELLDEDGEALDSESVWGIESDAGAYLDDTARELADEILGRLTLWRNDVTTYTIATLDGHLLATAPDGDDAMMQVRLAKARRGFHEWGYDFSEDELEYTSGLTLYQSWMEAEEAGAEIVYQTLIPTLEDADGRMIYNAAGIAPA